MKNIDRIHPFKSTIKKAASGMVTTLAADFKISAKESISFGTKTLLANYIYDKDENYNLVYTVIDNDGSEESFVEDDGILPTLCFRAQIWKTMLLLYPMILIKIWKSVFRFLIVKILNY